MSTKEIDRFVEAGAYAAEMARSVLLGTPIAKTSAWERPTTDAERAAMTEGMYWAAEEERLLAERRASAERARLQREQIASEAEAAIQVFDWL